jgi:hypothetical protein
MHTEVLANGLDKWTDMPAHAQEARWHLARRAPWNEADAKQSIGRSIQYAGQKPSSHISQLQDLPQSMPVENTTAFHTARGMLTQFQHSGECACCCREAIHDGRADTRCDALHTKTLEWALPGNTVCRGHLHKPQTSAALHRPCRLPA